MSAPHRDRSIVWPGGPSLCGPHAVASFATCPQLHAFSHELHLRPVISKQAAAVGTLLHAGLAYYYASNLQPWPDWFVYKDGHEAIKVLGADRPDFADLALRMFDGYVAQYTRCNWQPVLVEHQFVVDFDGMPYSARIDLLVREGNDLVLVDHKSIGRISAGMGDGYEADWQMLTGLAQCRTAGYDVKRVVINAISREMPFPKYQRFIVPILPTAYNRLAKDIAYHLRQLKAVRAEFPDPRDRPRNGNACVGKYGKCDYFDVCQRGVGWEQLHVPSEYRDGREKAGT